MYALKRSPESLREAERILERHPRLERPTRSNPQSRVLNPEEHSSSPSSSRLDMLLSDMAERLDGKYEVTRELEKTEVFRSVEALDSSGRKVRVHWFTVNDPKSRSGFHRYRTAVKNAGSPLLLDAVARPGAYYTVWEPLEGVTATTWLEGHPKDEAFRKALRELGDILESYGFALQDAHVLALQDDKGVRPALADLAIADRTSEEIKALNTAFLEPAKAPRAALLGKRSPPPAKVAAAPKGNAKTAPLGRTNATPTQKMPSSLSPRRRLTIWGIFPGILLLGVAGWYGAQAVGTFLEPPTVVVPSVVGKSLQDAAKLLSDARLIPRVTEGSDQAQVKGIILTQNPAPGTNLTEQRIVEITVNRPRPLLMPDLAGKSLSEAKLALREVKLEMRVTVIPAPDGVARDQIIGQSPPAQTEVVKGQAVRVLAAGSRAPQGRTFIPDLSGLSFEDAKLIVNAAGLRLVDIRSKSSNLPEGTVLGQTPAAYTTVPLESDATITVSVVATARQPVIPRPVQPPPPPPPPPPPDPNGATPPVDPNAGTDPVGANGLPPVTNPEGTTPEPNNNLQNGPQNPNANNPDSPNANQICTVAFSYIVPAELGTATIEIRVKDDDGERPLLPATPLPGGQPWEQNDIPVRGKAFITVFVDGVSQPVVEPEPKC